MNDEIESEFDDITTEAIEKAEKVECSLEDFAKGLEAMETGLRARRQDVKREIAERGE